MAIRVDCTVRGDKAFRRAMTGSKAALIAAVGLELERQADNAIAYIGNNYTTLFTNPKGALKDSLFREEFKSSGSRVSVRAGWGVKYGRVLEYGPRNKGPKPIFPGKSTSTHTGKPTVALRIDRGGEIVYRARTTYIWKESMRRPHWKKAVDESRGKRNANMRRAVMEAIRKSMGMSGG